MDVCEFVAPMDNLLQTGSLVLGAGSRKDLISGKVCGPLPKLTPGQMATVQLAKKYAMEQSIKNVLAKQTVSHQQQQAKSQQRHQAVILMSRIYVGSIHFEVREDVIRQAFLPFGPIRSITMSWDPSSKRHKGFGFVEFEIPEAAQLALEQMNGAVVSGRNIKVGRPSNMPQAQAVIQEIGEEAKKFHRIYIASIHPELSEADIRSVFEAFGRIITCEIPSGPIQGRHKGVCFIEYAAEQSLLDAISSMNMFDLGGQHLRVGRAITPPELTNLGPLPTSSTPVAALPQAAAVAAAAATAKIQAIDAVATNLGINALDLLGNRVMMAAASLATNPNAAVAAACANRLGQVSGVLPAHLVQQATQLSALSRPLGLVAQDLASKMRQQDDLKKLSKSQGNFIPFPSDGSPPLREKLDSKMNAKGSKRDTSDSVVVVLRNMVTPEEVDEDLQVEVEEETSKFGVVEKVIIYQERQGEDEDADAWVKIFVEFQTPSSARAARDALHGRYFGGRIISAQIYEQELYDCNDLSG